MVDDTERAPRAPHRLASAAAGGVDTSRRTVRRRRDRAQVTVTDTQPAGGPGSDIHASMTAVTTLNRELTIAYLAGDRSNIERLLAEISAAERRRNRLMQRTLTDLPSTSAALPVREQVARVLTLLARPAPVALIRDVAAARFGDNLSAPQLASLRRDEHRSWTSATSKGAQRAVSRPVYVVPALTYDRVAPMRGVLALSSWPVAARLIAPASARVDLLHIIDRLVDEAFKAPDASWAPNLRSLLWRLGRAVPGGEGTDLVGLRQAVAAELASLDATDASQRADAAKRAVKQLGEEHQLFGTTHHVTLLPRGGEEH